MNLQFTCSNQVRRQRLIGSGINGIDFLEVLPDQVHLEVHFINALDPMAPLTAANFFIEGGVRITGIQVTDLEPVNDHVLQVTASAAGDFSSYTLRVLVAADNPAPPPGYDQVLSEVSFSFRAACASDFDCQLEQACAEPLLPAPVIDYLSKDYASFRQLMLDRLAVTMPDWTERNPADVLVTLVELLAYVGDDLSYRQDAIAAESYLGTCRRRTSARRHARLLQYYMHEGCNARAWIHFETKAVVQDLDAGTQVISGVPGQAVVIADLNAETDQSFVVFETMQAVSVRQVYNRISLWTWGDTKCCLPTGATGLSLVRTGTMALAAGDLLLLEEVANPVTGSAADADPAHRQVVRLTAVLSDRDDLYGVDVYNVEWAPDDALTFPLCLSAEVKDATDQFAGNVMVEVAVARANIALADHGRTLTAEPLQPPQVPGEGDYLPSVSRSDLTFAQVLATTAAPPPASAIAVADPRQALPAITLHSSAGDWSPKYDLLDSDRFARDFVIEMEDDRVAHIRFGDDVHGRRPAVDDSFMATYRVGSGTVGNVGREALRRVVGATGITVVRNPLPAVGGVEPELLESVRQLAPQAFRLQNRAVTEADYAEVATRYGEVLNAAARLRWTGSWWTVFLTVERRGGQPVDLAFRGRLIDFVDQFRLAGYDLEVEGPVYVPLDVQVEFCVESGFFADDVRQAITRALTGRAVAGTPPPFFAPDNFAFGQPVYLSQVYEAVLAVPGVSAVAVKRFQRWGKTANHELENGLIPVDPLEVVQLANDRNFPENGKLEVTLGGAA